MNKNEILKIITKALKKLIKKDGSLIEREMHEECINHKFAMYLEEYISKVIFYKENSLSVDMEYNKNGSNSKTLNNEINGKIPDIIVHRRETNDENLILIECKKDTLINRDKEKLKTFLRDLYSYKYTLGVEYKPLKDSIILFLYERDGEDITREKYLFNKHNFRLELH